MVIGIQRVKRLHHGLMLPKLILPPISLIIQVEMRSLTLTDNVGTDSPPSLPAYHNSWVPPAPSAHMNYGNAWALPPVSSYALWGMFSNNYRTHQSPWSAQDVPGPNNYHSTWAPYAANGNPAFYSNHAPQMPPQVFPSSNHTMEPEVLETANQQGYSQRLRNHNRRVMSAAEPKN